MKRFVHVVCLIATAALLAPVSAAVPAPAPAAMRPVSDTYFGTTLVDPYRWMEGKPTPELLAYLHAQNDYTRAVFSQLPARARILQRISQLSGSSDAAPEAQLVLDRYFYLFRPAGANNPKLYMRAARGGTPKVLVDPDKLNTGGKQYAIAYYNPSLDGRYVAYGIAQGGTEDATLYVLDADTGRRLPESIDRAQFGNPTWRLDNASFYFTRLQKLAADAPITAKFQNTTTYLHKLGTSAAKDVPILGPGLNARVAVGPDDNEFLLVSPASPYAVAAVVHGVKNEVDLYSAPLAGVTSAKAPWKRIVGSADAVTGMDVRGRTIYLLTHKNAARFKVVATSLARPDYAHARTIVAPSNVVIQALGVARDALYIRDLDGGLGGMRRVPFTPGAIAQRVPLPYPGAIDNFSTDPRLEGVLFSLNAWTKARQWYRDLGPSNAMLAAHLVKPSPVDFSSITSVEVKAPGLDGTPIPLSIIYKKGLKLDGSHPTWLEGYGAYGLTPFDPYFDPTRLAFLERGGVMAYAHVRGGGEYGEDWHRAGMIATKHNTWEDFIACGRYLIAQHYTSSPHLGGMGTSAGGITIGRAITQSPQLFGAAISDVGVADPLRSEFSANGPPNIPEFGSVTTLAGFKALYAMDPFMHVKDGVPYPAVLLITGANDPRVDSWEAAKMTARLQQATSSGKPILLRVDFNAGHGFGSSRTQRDELNADEMTFLLWQLGNPAFAGVPKSVGPYPKATPQASAVPASAGPAPSAT